MSKEKPNGYWNNYDRCYNEAKKYSTITDFAKGSGGAHHRAKANGWIRDYTWFADGIKRAAESRVKWNYETCYELAKQCSKKSEMKILNQRAYAVALQNGWFKDYTWFMSDYEIRHKKRPLQVKWTFERCYNLAAKCKTLSEFEKKHKVAAVVCRKNGWLNFFDWLKRGNQKFDGHSDNVYAYIFEKERAVYVGRTIDTYRRDQEHRTSKLSAVFLFSNQRHIAIPQMTILESGLTLKDGLRKEDYYRSVYEKDGWNVLNKAKTGITSGSIGSLGDGKLSKNYCKKIAKGCTTLKELRKKFSSVYNKALKMGWLKDYNWLSRASHGKYYWTKEKCMDEAKKYTTRTEFQDKSPSAYSKALKEKWLDDYTWFLNVNTQWTYDLAFKEASKYKNMSDFIKNAGGAYNASRRNKWIERFTWLKKKDISQKQIEQYTLDGKLVRMFNGAREASRITGISYSGISQCCNGKLRKHGGYIWKYTNGIIRE